MMRIQKYVFNFLYLSVELKTERVPGLFLKFMLQSAQKYKMMNLIETYLKKIAIIQRKIKLYQA